MELRTRTEIVERLANVTEACANRIDPHPLQIDVQDQAPINQFIEKSNLGTARNPDSLEELLAAVTELDVLVSARAPAQTK